MTFGRDDIKFGASKKSILHKWRTKMTWMTPQLQEVSCSMEVNMYFPAEDDTLLF